MPAQTEGWRQLTACRGPHQRPSRWRRWMQQRGGGPPTAAGAAPWSYRPLFRACVLASSRLRGPRSVAPHCVRTVRKPRFSWPEPLIGCWRWGWSSAQIRPASSAAKPPQLFRVSVTFSPRMAATMSRAGCAPPQPPAHSSTLRSSAAVRRGPLRSGPAAGRRRRGSGSLGDGATTTI